MNYEAMLKLVYTVACDYSQKGVDWSQRTPVLCEVKKKSQTWNDIDQEQLILTCWNDLFTLGLLSWGYNLDNPDAPLFHIPTPTTEHERKNVAGFPQIELLNEDNIPLEELLAEVGYTISAGKPSTSAE